MRTFREAMPVLVAVLASSLACHRGEEPQAPSDAPPWWECDVHADCAAGELCSSRHLCGAPELVFLSADPQSANRAALFYYAVVIATGYFDLAGVPDAPGASVELLADGDAVVSHCDPGGWCWVNTDAWPEGTYVIRGRATFPGRVLDPDLVVESAPAHLVVDHASSTY